MPKGSVIFQFGIISLICLGLFTSCNRDQEGYRKTKDGLFYKFIDDKGGKSPILGDILVMDISYFNGKGELLFDSKVLQDSFTVELVKPTFKGGVEEGFAMMSVGDSAMFKVNGDSLFSITFKGESPYKNVPGEQIRFSVRMRNIIPKGMADSIRVATDLRLRREEFAVLDSFLRNNGMDVIPTKNGAYLSISKEGIGPQPEAGDTVFVKYKGSLLNGTVFDSTQTAPLPYVVGVTPVIEGWAECVPMLTKGAIARMAFPSDLGYGSVDMGHTTLFIVDF
jgi:FKBP-type peptidyl-prolyl cis-trans isomerase